ncbi:MAG: ATP-binding protein [Desulfamplus sp.]|nr:ATP-binding protein [Desulfamplus sp.]
MIKKKLPIGIQTFSEMITEGYYYVDKTPYAHRLITEGKHYFLSRPRRFGKSLFLDTLKDLFEGREELFRGLDIHDKWDFTKSNPVIHISFGGGVLESRAQLDRRIRDLLRINQQRLTLECQDIEDVAGCFGELIRNAHDSFGSRVVVLVDEYDKPILDNITDSSTAIAMRTGLRNLYSVIKDMDAHIRFSFITGVSKFSKVSLFSGINNLSDISVDASYSAICGYTQKEVDTVFAPELELLALVSIEKEQIRHWYNGYNWLGETVYNPFDLLLLFQKRDFRSFWFETGTPEFLIKVLTTRKQFVPALEHIVAIENLLSRFDVNDISTEALLFQTGYLTIDHVEWTGAKQIFHLRYPNHEVRMGLTEQLLFALNPESSSPSNHIYRLHQLLSANDLEGLKGLFQSFYATIPHHWYDNNPIAQYEGYYASIFYSYFAALGLDVRLEDVTNHGRIDMTVKFNHNIYLFEFKVVELFPEGRAILQLKNRNYAEKYRAEGLPIHLIGVEFSKKERNVVGFEVETLPRT